MNLSDTCAVITGSTSGIGLGIAEALAGAGANVVLNSYTDDDEDRALADDIAKRHGVKAAYVSADMSDGAACARLVEEARRLFGTVKVLVNNAGIQHVAHVEEFPVAKWDAIIAINMSSAFHTIRAAVPGMRQAGEGRIVNVASVHGLTASPFKSAYVTAKHGVIGLTKTVALELAREGDITCNAVCPGYVLTPLVEAQIPDQMKTHGMTRDEVISQVMLERQPTKEFVTVEGLGGTVVFLCSDHARQMTGQAVTIDGGWTAM